MESLPSSKPELREHFLKARLALDSKTRERFEESIKKTLSGFLEQRSGIWTTYSPMKGEVDISGVDAHRGIVWALPIVKNDQMMFAVPQDADELKPGAFGILEPDLKTAKVVSESDISGVLVPGVAFDKNGHRLGMGKGFYDRFLQRFLGLKVGVAFSVQISKRDLPREAHDVAVDFLITDDGILEI